MAVCPNMGVSETGDLPVTSFIRFFGRIAVAFVLVLVALPAFAGEIPFTAKAFADAQAADKPILVEVHASWCTTCRAQKTILDRLTSEPRFSHMTVLRIDYDAQKDVMRQFGVQVRATLIVFKGETELGRSVGDTHKNSIEALLAKAIQPS